MSAAEKLKALDAHGFPVVTDYGLRRALPQIVAVVEAAAYEAGATGTENYTGPRLRAALAALDEALGEEKDESWRSGLWRQRS